MPSMAGCSQVPASFLNMTRLHLTPVSSLRVSRHHQIPRHDLLPNTSVQNKPLLIYHSCIPSSALPSNIESHLKEVGVVIPQWRYTMYSTTHFHSTTHEVLCISSGRAKLCFGGEENPGRVEPLVTQGDVIIIPAGVGHRLLDDYNSGFEMIGSYPKGKGWDMFYGKSGEEDKVKAIGELGWFTRDPMYGDVGPALEQ